MLFNGVYGWLLLDGAMAISAGRDVSMQSWGFAQGVSKMPGIGCSGIWVGIDGLKTSCVEGLEGCVPWANVGLTMYVEELAWLLFSPV